MFNSSQPIIYIYKIWFYGCIGWFLYVMIMSSSHKTYLMAGGYLFFNFIIHFIVN